jgi:hypothetical protein
MAAKKDAISNNLHPFEEGCDVCRGTAAHIKHTRWVKSANKGAKQVQT